MKSLLYQNLTRPWARVIKEINHYNIAWLLQVKHITIDIYLIWKFSNGTKCSTDAVQSDWLIRKAKQYFKQAHLYECIFIIQTRKLFRNVFSPSFVIDFVAVRHELEQCIPSRGSSSQNPLKSVDSNYSSPTQLRTPKECARLRRPAWTYNNKNEDFTRLFPFYWFFSQSSLNNTARPQGMFVLDKSCRVSYHFLLPQSNKCCT